MLVGFEMGFLALTYLEGYDSMVLIEVVGTFAIPVMYRCVRLVMILYKKVEQGNRGSPEHSVTERSMELICCQSVRASGEFYDDQPTSDAKMVQSSTPRHRL